MDLKTYLSKCPRGTAASLAKALGISPSYLSQIASGLVSVSPERAVSIEKQTLGAVSRREFFRDNWSRIWPELSQQEVGHV